MMVSPSALTYRLQGCPISVDEAALCEGLARIFDITPDNVRIHSLATAPWERPPTKTATLQFTKLPSIIDTIETEWNIEGQGLGALILDTHFLGLTPLNEVGASEHCFE